MTAYFIAQEGGEVYHESGFTVDWSEITPWNFTSFAYKTSDEAASVIEKHNLDARIIPRTIEFDV